MKALRHMKAMSILGVVSPSTAAVAEPAGKPSLTKTILPGVALGVAGVMANPKHPFLGFLGGEAIGMNGFRLWRGQGSDRTIALTNLTQTGSIIAGSLMWKKQPFWGGLAGLVVGVALTSFIPESNSHNLFRSE